MVLTRAGHTEAWYGHERVGELSIDVIRASHTDGAVSLRACWLVKDAGSLQSMRDSTVTYTYPKPGDHPNG